VSYQDGSAVTLAYDAASRRTGVTDAAGVTGYTYDPVGRPVVVDNPGGRIVSLTYDNAGRRANLVEPGGGVFTYTMDGASRLAGVVNPSGERTTLAYDPVGRIATLTYANGATATYSYDAGARTTGVRNAKSEGTAIAGFTYTLDDAGNPTGMVLANGDRVTWTYDSLNRLTREQRDGANAYDTTYTYDATSNRLTKLASGTTTTYSYDNADALVTENAGGAVTTYTYNAGDALTVENAGGSVTTYSYDNVGNTTVVEASGGATSYTWDPENRLTGLVLPAGGGTWTMAYDPSGLRREKQAAGTTTRFIFDGQRLLQETDGSNVTQAQYTSLLGAYGPTVSQRRSGVTTYLHPDHLGTIEALSAADQSVVDTYLFDAWGRAIASSGSTVNPHRYIGALGYYTEPSLNLDYVRARWLRPGTGSWLSVDPVRGENRYGYADGQPTARLDASGRLQVADILRVTIFGESGDRPALVLRLHDGSRLVGPGASLRVFPFSGSGASPASKAPCGGTGVPAGVVLATGSDAWAAKKRIRGHGTGLFIGCMILCGVPLLGGPEWAPVVALCMEACLALL
jgi:RHS repeat-associated protein